jgi:TPR repeat protein
VGKAVAFFTEGAELGNPGCQYKLGMLLGGEAARLWVRRAALAGLTDAQHQVGLWLLEAGERAAAEVWIRRAAEQGDPRARHTLREFGRG